MDQFEGADYVDRRRMIALARNRGSVPHEIAAELFDAIQLNFMPVFAQQ